MIKYINLTIYILILLIIVIIISRRDIIERYVDINKFGNFIQCDTCENGSELKGCRGLDMGSCEPCRAGTAGIGGICNKCTGNKYSLEGETNCSPCGDGERPNRKRSGCDDCPSGTAGMGGVCNKCTGNQYSPNSGATECSTCGDGERPNRKRSGCDDCPSGTAGMGGLCNIRCTGNKYSIGGATSCLTCDSDGYRVNSNNTACQACPAGSDGRGGYCNNVSQIACGHEHTMFLTSSNKVYGSGNNQYHQINSSGGTINNPIEITNYPPGETITQIVCGGHHTMFLTSSNKVYGCGNNDSSQIKSSSSWSSPDSWKISQPIEITEFSPGETITQIACGGYHTMFLTSSNKVYSRGYIVSLINSDSSTQQITGLDFSPQLGGGETITQIACGEMHTIFLTSRGKIYGSGQNNSKQINSSDNYYITIPTEITEFDQLLEGGETITQIACSSRYTIFLTESGVAYGRDERDVLVPISNLASHGRIKQIACGEKHTIFLTDLGKVYGRGSNYNKQINSRRRWDFSQLTEITDFPELSVGETITQIACGHRHTMYLTDLGKIYRIGDNGYNQVNNMELIIL